MRAGASVAERLALLPVRDRQAALAGLSESEVEALLYDWRGFNARPDQIAPEGKWLIWAIIAGRGFGKTRSGAEWVREQVKAGKRRIALIAETQRDLEQVVVEGDSGILACCPKDEMPVYTKKPVKLVFPNGATAQGYNGTEPDQLRGPQFDAAWCDELAKWAHARAAWDQLQFGLRLGDDPRVLVTTTPRPTELIKSIVAGNEGPVHVTRGRTADNIANLAPSFVKSITERYGGTRMGRQELEAEILGDLPGALWSLSSLDAYRLREAPEMGRILVAVDPAVTATEDSDEHGIIVGGLSAGDKRGIVLEDASLSGSPRAWAQRAVSVYRSWQADGIVIEVNQGGDMVAHTIRTVDPTVRIIEVRASRGKHVRAEPIASRYERGEVAHVGSFVELENQMCVTGDTLIETQRGQVRIDQLNNSDIVMTRKGFAPIHWVGYTGKAKRLVHIRTQNSELRVTECHPIYMPDLSDFVVAGSVAGFQRLLESDNWQHRSRGDQDGSIAWKAGTTKVETSFYTGSFMRPTLGQFLTATMSTILTKTRQTTSRAILLLCCRLTTSTSISALGSTLSGPSLVLASFAGLKRNLSGRGSQPNTAATHARRGLQEPRGGSQLQCETAKSVNQSLRQNEAIKDFAVGFASNITGCETRPSDGEPVYNLSVAAGYLPEYFANGVLVHNCQMTLNGYEGPRSPDRVDALVWLMSALFPAVAERPKAPPIQSAPRQALGAGRRV